MRKNLINLKYCMTSIVTPISISINNPHNIKQNCCCHRKGKHFYTKFNEEKKILLKKTYVSFLKNI